MFFIDIGLPTIFINATPVEVGDR